MKLFLTDLCLCCDIACALFVLAVIIVGTWDLTGLAVRMKGTP